MVRRGKAGTISTASSLCVLPTCPLTQSRMSSVCAVRPGFKTMKPTGVSPHLSDGTPTTAASRNYFVLVEDRLQIARIDVEATRVDHVFLAIHQSEKAIL